MNSLLHSHSTVAYSSEAWHHSVALPGVRFAVRKLSLGGRLRLTEQLRVLLQKYEFLRAGDSLENTDASLGDLLVRKLYLEAGLLRVEGLSINGQDPDVSTLFEDGPEALCDEIIAAFRAGLELSEDERKNS